MYKVMFFCALILSGVTLEDAHAQTDNWIFGAGLGTANYADGEYDDNDLLWMLSAGYRITENLTIEGTYLDLGRVNDSILPSNNLSLIQDTLFVDASGLAVSAVWQFPVSDRWFLMGRFGMTFLDIEKQWVGGTVVDPVLAADNGGNETNPFYGVGAGLKLSDKVSLSGEWNRLDVANIDVDGFYLKINFLF